VTKKLDYFIKCGKDALKPCQRTDVVYKINCANCEACYIGQTKRHVCTRVREHMNDVRKATMIIDQELFVGPFTQEEESNPAAAGPIVADIPAVRPIAARLTATRRIIATGPPAGPAARRVVAAGPATRRIIAADPPAGPARRQVVAADNPVVRQLFPAYPPAATDLVVAAADPVAAEDGNEDEDEESRDKEEGQQGRGDSNKDLSGFCTNCPPLTTIGVGEDGVSS
ncbi:hypothetical protein X777_05469, partial [Ooceraea biroi]